MISSFQKRLSFSLGGVPAQKATRFMLDNAAKLYPAVATAKWSSVFRMSIILHEPVDSEILQTAAERVLPRFPTMAVRMRRGFFWYFFEENRNPFFIRKDTGLNCARFRWHENNGYLLRVLYANRRISIEFFHSVTDGYGALVFLKTLVSEYLRQCGHNIPCGDGVLDLDTVATPAEMEDSFLKMPLPREGIPRGGTTAYHFTDERLPPHGLRITMAHMPTAAVQEKAKALGVTITEYLAAAMLYVGYLDQQKRIIDKQLPVRISIPVNMRQYYPTHTLRNFSSFVNPGIDPSEKSYTFEEIAREVHIFMGSALEPEHLFAGISSNVASERNLIVRAVPLPIKNLAIRAVFNANGDRLVTTTLTNLGRIQAPEAMLAHIERFELILGPSAKGTCTNSALMTTGIMMSLAFTSNARNALMAVETIRFLTKMGIPITTDD